MTKASFKTPDALVIIVGVLLLAIALTWLIPAGEFERHKVGSRMVVVPDTYRAGDANPVPWHGIFTAPVRGFADRDAAQIIAFVLFIGGAFALINATGAITAAIQWLVRCAGDNPARRRLLIPVLMLGFSICGNTFGMSEEVLVFIMITIPLAHRLGWDTLVGVAIPFVGAGVGFSGAAFNPFTVGIAQGLSELPIFSGWPLRMMLWATLTTIAIAYVMRYAARIEKDPRNSLLPNHAESHASPAMQAAADEPLTARRVAVLLSLVAGIGLLIYGVTKWDWYIEEIAALFIGLGLLAAVLGKISPNAAAQAFSGGARDMVGAVIIIALSKSVLLVMQDGRIIDTVLQAVSAPLRDLPPAVSAQAMLVTQFGLNFFVPSGSGQAALTMPIMAPLADLLHIPRQAAVLAFQIGDGLCNFVIPTSGVTMGILFIAKIPFGTWLRWIGWLMAWLLAASAIFLALGASVVTW